MFGKRFKRTCTSLLTAVLVFACFPLNNVLAEDYVTVQDLNFDFSDTLMPIYMRMSSANIDFFNVDFTSFNLEKDENARLIHTAELFVPVKYYESMVIIDASSLKTYMREAFDINLPLKTIGEYAYSPEDNTFSYPAADGGAGLDRWKVTELISNGDGTITAKADLYTFGMTVDADFFKEEIKKPADLWDKSITRGKAASSEITFRVNEEYKFYPMQLVRVKTQLHDWKAAQGTYESEDGKYRIAFGVDNRYDQPPFYVNSQLNVVATDLNKNNKYWLNANVFNNSAALHSKNYTLDAFMSLNADGSITVSDVFGTYGLDLSGKYKKVSKDIPALTPKYNFNIESIMRQIPGSEEIYLGSYFTGSIEGMGSSSFSKTVSAHIEKVIKTHADEFNKTFDEYIDEANKETSSSMSKELLEKAKEFSYNSTVDLVTSSDFYYAISEYVDEYTGGAHGDTYIRMFNIDAKKEKILTLDDLFKDSRYKKVLSERLTEMAGTDAYKDLVFSDLKELTVSDENEFYLTDQGLVIIYPRYLAGPSSSGIIRFTIPFSELKDVMNDEYLNGQYMRELNDQDLFNAYMGN